MITLAFPSLAAPTVLVTLPDVEQRFGLPPLRKRQAAFITDALTDVIFDFGSDNQVFTMVLGPLSNADADAVQSFFANSSGANGRVGAWQLQRSNGNIYNVRFAQDVIEQQPVGVSWINMSLTLRVLP